MPTRKKDASREPQNQVARITKTPLPKGEDLLGSEELKKELAEAKKRLHAKR